VELAESALTVAVMLPPEVKPELLAVIGLLLVKLVGAAVSVPKLEVEEVMVPFDAKLLPLNVLLPVWVIVAEPEAPGPVMVTWLPDALAVNPVAGLTFAAIRDAIVELLELDAVAPVRICVPFTVMPVIDVLPLPPIVIVAVPVPAAVITGVKPDAPAGPVIVTVEPATDAE